MKRFSHLLGIAALLMVTALTSLESAAGRFDQKLPADRQIVHALNRMTFGALPGEVEEVRRLGVEKWIDLQLHPDRIQEDSMLEAMLKPLGSLSLTSEQILNKYRSTNSQMMMAGLGIVNAIPLNTATALSKISVGSLEERQKALAALSPQSLQEVFAAAPQHLEDEQLLAGLPADLRKDVDQMRSIRTGTAADKMAALRGMDSSKRQQILRTLGPQAFLDVAEFRREAMAATQPQQLVSAELVENKLIRAIHSRRQLEEVLVDFWMNHFNVYKGKGAEWSLLTSFERDAIRSHVFGRFQDMLLATARHPAMLLYLDNAQSQGVRGDLPTTGLNGEPLSQPGLNENYGRELMELHTMGADGGYTQQDVIDVARALTGWSIRSESRYPEFEFKMFIHDWDKKVVLGRALPARRGEEDGLDVIDILAHHPSTAKFISRKLAQRFVSDDPPQSLVDRMAETFTKTDGDLRAVLEAMFSSIEFSSEGAWQSKLKSPLEIVVSAVRAINADVTDTYALADRIAGMGQPLYGKLEPTGYPNTGEGWESAFSILGRINFATAMTSGGVPGVKVDISRFKSRATEAVAGELLAMPPSPAMLALIEKAAENVEGKELTPETILTVVLSSPEFQRR